MNKQTVCVAMQPTYLPWIGYFDLIDQCSLFVFLDNVQFSVQSWHQRNRIRTTRGLEWLTVPVRKKGRHLQHIADVEIIRSPAFPNKHVRSLEVAYSRSKFFASYFPVLTDVLRDPEPSLCALNVKLIRWITQILGIEERFVLASESGATGKRSDFLVDICRRLGADTYLSPLGSLDYLAQEYSVFDTNGISLMFHHYDHPVYSQLFEPFIPYASAIDLLFNEGNGSLEIIRSGRGTPYTIEEALSRSINEAHHGE